MRRLLSALLMTFAPTLAHAMDSPVNLTVLNGWQQEDGTVIAGIKLDLDEGWKTYWRAPGEGGIPPLFDFTRSSNLEGFSVEWPAPVVFDQGGLRSIGYSDFVIFPLALTPANGTRDIKLRGSIELGVCKEVCIPMDIRINAKLPVDSTSRNPAIAAALVARPFSAEEAGVEKATCKLSPTDGGMTLSTSITMPSAGASEYTVIESADPDHWLTETENGRSGNTLTSTSFLASVSGQTLMVNRSDLRITVLGSDYAVDIQGCSGG